LNYNQDDKAVKCTRNSQVTVPVDTRPMDKKIQLSPGPGSYETEKRTSLATKIESKNSIRTNFSDTASFTTAARSTFSSMRPTSKSEMLKYFSKSRSSLSGINIAAASEGSTVRPFVMESGKPQRENNATTVLFD